MDMKAKRPREMDGGGSQPEEVVGELAMQSEDWRRTLSRVVSAVAALNITAPRAFDTEVAGIGSATGFVVDKIRGIMLTNRHVVLPGPVVAEATFANREEIPVYPIYRDPVHDFGFFRYNPASIYFHEHEEIPLAPEAASVGLEIRIVGNDSNEKVSILEGTLARLDREAPNYKKDGYNDFNTFYMQAAAGTKGGSSGSPVVDCQGRAVALNAGGRSSGVSAFFLPLERVVRALNLIRACWDTYGIGSQPESVYIPRGTLQVTFQHKGFEQTRRLGLKIETEKMVRQVSPAGETGMLVVHSTVPNGPAHGELEPGDVLIRMNGDVVTKFLTMESLLDENVDKEISLQIDRGGIPVTVTLKVKDLHSITPNHFLELSGAVIHPLSYQQARNFRLECGLVYVAEAGYMLSRASVPRHAVIKKLDGVKIKDLNELIDAFSNLSMGAEVVLQYVTYTEPHRMKDASVRIDQHGCYMPPQLYHRNDTTGVWAAKPAMPLESEYMVSFRQGGHTDVNSKGIPRNSGSTKGSDFARTLPGFTSLAEREIEPALVRFEVFVPPICMIDGVHAKHFVGAGLIIHHSDSLGLIAVDRNTVAISISDITLSFAAHSIKIPGEVVFLHPAHNFALVAYDPSALGDGASVIRAAELRPEPALRRGDPVYLVGVNESLQVISRETKVANYAPINIFSGDCPRYRAMNMDVIELDYAGYEYSGVVTDEQGRVQALWASASRQVYGCTSKGDDQFVVGIPIYLISQVLEKIISGAPGPFRLINGIWRTMPSVRLLEVELYPVMLSDTRSYGLSDSWVQALIEKDPMRRQLLKVKGCFAGSKAKNVLEDRDMILAINKEPITCFLDIDNACQNLVGSDEMLKITIFREGKEIDLIVGTDLRDGSGTTRLVHWCGCIFQNPHSAVCALGFMPKEGHGVYVSRYYNGSPGHRYGLCAPQWITEVNGRPTPDLESFIEVLKGLEDGVFVKLKTVLLSGESCVLALKQDLHYWPTWELSFEPKTATWRRRTIKSLQPAAA